MNIEQFLIEQVGQEKPRPGLDRLHHYLPGRLEQIKKTACKVITVAGTNGKGQTAMGLAKIFSMEKISYTLWTSPHIENICERFDSSSGAIDELDLKKLIDQILSEVKRAQVILTYYEVLFLAFIDFTLQKRPEVIILEVGLGGRLDAVNVLDADLVAITSISRDHQDFLGTKYKGILAEKYGVTRSGAHLISSLELKYLREELQRLCQRDGVSWLDLFENGELTRQKDYIIRNQTLSMSLAKWYLEKMGRNFDFGPWESLLKHGNYKARFDQWEWEGTTVVFNGGHNLDGIRKLIQKLESEDYNLRKIDDSLFSFSKRNPGELHQILTLLQLKRSLFGHVHLTRFEHSKAVDWKKEELSSFFSLVDWANELEKKVAEKKYILVSGSYYFVGEIQKYLRLRYPHGKFSSDLRE